MKIQINKLVELANNYLLAENEYHAFAKTLKYRWMPSNSTEDQVRYAEHWRETNTYYNSVQIVCQMLDIDINKLIAVVKAANRHEKKMKYQVCVYLGAYGVEERVRRFLENNDGWGTEYFKSTGRRIVK